MTATITRAQFEYACDVVRMALTPSPPMGSMDRGNPEYFKNASSEKLLAYCQWVVTMVADGKIEVTDG